MLGILTEPFKVASKLGGQCPPFATLVDANVYNAMPQADGSGDTHGVLYPTNFDSTTQAIINTNASALKGSFALDDNLYSQDEEKYKVIGDFFNEVKAVNAMMMHQPLIAPIDMSLDTDNTCAQQYAGFSAGFVKIRIVSNALKCRYTKPTADNTVSEGTEITIAASGVQDQSARIVYLTATTALVTWIETSTIKAAVVTVDENANTVSAGATQTSGITSAKSSNGMGGIALINTDKIGGSYVKTDDTLQAYAATISGATVTWGTPLQIDAGAASVNSTVRQVGSVWKCDTDKFFVLASVTNFFVYSISVSTTTCTKTAVTTSLSTVLIGAAVINKCFVFFKYSTTTISHFLIGFGETATGSQSTENLLTVSGVTGWARAQVLDPTGNPILVVKASVSGGVTRVYTAAISADSDGAQLGMTRFVTAIDGNGWSGAAYQCGTALLMDIDTSQSVSAVYFRATVSIAVDGTEKVTSQNFAFAKVFSLAAATGGRRPEIKITQKSSIERAMIVAGVLCNVE